MTSELVGRLLDVIEHDVLPLTREGVERGNKIFGAAVLEKTDLSLVVAGTNAEIENPLLHGEVATIGRLYALSPDERPAPRDCLFLSTHEPCSMCLSAIAWAGYDTIYYLFPYQKTRDAFAIPHDLRILEEVFRCPNGAYARENAYWTSHEITRLLATLARDDQERLAARVSTLEREYRELSKRYQMTKSTNAIPLK